MTIMVYVNCPLSVVMSHYFLPSCTQIGVTLNDVTSFPAKIAYKAISSTIAKVLMSIELQHEISNNVVCSQALEGKPSSQKYVFLEGIAFQLNNFTMDGFSFQFFFTENWKVLPSILMTSFGRKTLPKHPFHCKFGIRSDSRSQG